MRKLYKIVFFLILVNTSCVLNANNNSKENNLLSPTATISGTTNVCQNAPAPQITFTGSGGTAPYTFTYTVTGATGNQTVTTTSGNSVSISASTTTAGVFTYTLVSVTDSSDPQAQTQTGSATVTVNPSPDAEMGGTGSGSIFNGIPVFRFCSNTVTSFTFTNTSSTLPLNSNYTINWGDSSPDFNSTSWSSTTHTYAVGLWNLTYTIQGNNGCSTVKKYLVFVGSNPAVSLGNPGNTDICNSSSLTFPITGTTNNPLGTTYTVTFNDGSTPKIFNHPPPPSVTHTFLKSSCGVTSSDGTNSYPNSFSAIIVASNPCNISSVGVVPIYVSTPPKANFTLPTKGCTNTSICMTNSSTGAYENNGSNSSCDTSPKIIWSISPSTGFSISSDSLGNDFSSTDPSLWLTGSNILCLNFSQAGTYTITMKTGNRCGFDTKTQQICIEAPLTPTFTLNNTSDCSPKSITATNTTVTTNSCTIPTYLWAVTYSPTNCGTSSNYTLLNGTTLTSFAPEFNFINPGTYTITLTTKNSCVSVTSAAQNVIVKQPPTVTINPIANVCQTGSSTAINPTATVPACANATYAWSFLGGIPATSTLADPGPISYPTAGNYTVSLSVTNECGSTIANNRTFTINPPPTITGTLFSCVGLTSQLTGSATAATTNPWSSSNSSVATISATGLVTGVSGGTTTITYTNANNCKTTEVFTVNPAPTITPLVSSTVCIGGTPNVLSFTISGAAGTPTYQWYSNTTNSNTGGSIIFGETNTTFNPPNSVAGTFYYYCIITLPTGGCSDIKTNTAKVVITPLPTISTQPIATQSLCVGGAITSSLSVTATGGTGTLTYQWYSNTTNSTTGATPVGTNSPNYTPLTFNTIGTFYYYVVVSASGSGCGTATSTFSEVVVVADPTISIQPLVTQTQCKNAAATPLTVTAIDGLGTLFSYQWYTTGGNHVGTNASSYTPPTNAVGTFYYYCEVSQTGLGCSAKSNIATVVVVNAPQITTDPQSQSVCQGSPIAPLTVAFSNGTGTATYQWYDDNGLITGATGNTYTPTNTVTTGYYCIITFSSGGCTEITSKTATITINPQPTIIAQPLATQNLCVGGIIPTPLSVTAAGGTGTPSYQWYSTTNNTATGGIPVGTNSVYTPPALTIAQTYNYYVVITYSGGGCSSVTSDLAQIVVVNDPIVSSQPLVSQTLCQNTTPTNLTVVATGGIGTYSYQWFSSVSNSNAGGILISGETNNSYTPSTTNLGKRYYYCVISQTGIGCNVTSATSEVIVNLTPSITTQPQSSIVCLGIPPTLLSVAYSNGVGTPTYQWYSNTVNSTSGSTPISGATNATYNPQNTVVGTTYYYCIITFSTGGCSSLTSIIATVTINPNPVISNKTDLICSGKSFAVVPLNSGSEIVPAGTTYTWSNPIISPAGSITGASAQNVPQTTISQNLINTAISPATVTYNVSPLSGNCPGINFTVVVTVNPAISATVTSNNSTCFGSNSGAIQSNITGGIPPYTISWTGPNGYISSQSNISDLAPGDYNLSVADAGGCPFNKTYTITEPNDIIITTDLEKNITCFNAANGEIKITLTGGTLNYKIAWTKNGLPYAFTEDVANLSPGTYVVTVSDANNCGPKTATFTITEPPILAVNLVNKTNILCSGQSTGAIDVNVVGGTLPYTFAWSGPNGFSSSNQNLTTLFSGTYNLIVTDDSGCVKNLSVILTQNPEIKITATTTPILCYGDNNASINLAVTGGVAPYSIAWSNLGSGSFQNNLSAGDYIITVTDALNCTKTATVNIPEAPIFTVNPVVKNISCFGSKNGSITLNFVGGIAPVTLTWNDGAVTGTTRNNLGPGSYAVTIVDSKPCTIIRKFTILEPQVLALSANTTNAFDCNDSNSGAINLLVSGGSGPFTYAWSNGATTKDLVNIPAGNYLVTVTDVNGCSKQAQYSINKTPPIATNVVTKTDFNCDTRYVNKTFVADVSGGVPPYQLVWSSGTVSGVNNEIMNTSQNGTVILTATDAVGCKSNYTFTVAIPTLGFPSFNVGSYRYSTFGMYSINDPIQFTNTATGNFISVAWDFGDGTFSTELNPVHTFINPKDYVVTQTVTYPFGCVYVEKLTLTVGKGYVLVVPTAFTPNNDTLNDTFRPVTKALKNVRLDVYDTWGSMIYSEFGDVLRGWDGKIKGINAENGNYYCKVSGETFYGKIVNENHPFVLIK
jgi:gliding motility-associated-like protein